MMWNEIDTFDWDNLKTVKEYYEPDTRRNSVNMHHSYCYETWRQFTELDEYEQYVCDWVGHNKCGVWSVECGVSCCPQTGNGLNNGLPRRPQSGLLAKTDTEGAGKTRRNKGVRERFAEYRHLPLMSREEFIQLGVRSEELGVSFSPAANELDMRLRRIAELLRTCEPCNADRAEQYRFRRKVRLILELLTPEEV